MTSITFTSIDWRRWQILVITTLAFWVSVSLLVDLVLMPSMYATGMMIEPGFASAGYSIFWIFNRMEMLCGAIALTGILLLALQQWAADTRWTSISIAVILMAIPLIYTYALTPSMSALGMPLDLFTFTTETPAPMTLLHGGYLGLEFLKVGLAGWLLRDLFTQLVKG